MSGQASAVNYGLGQGILSQEQIGVDSCVTGDIQVVNSAFQEVITDFAGDQSFQLKQLKGRMALGVDTKLFGVQGNLDMLSSTQESPRSITILMTYSTIAKEIFLLNVKAIPGKERGLCGDRFIRSRRLGGRFIIAYTFNFESDIQRKHFTADATVSLFFGLFKKTYTKSKINDKDVGNVTVQLRAWQFGGDSSALAKLMSSIQPNVCTYASPDKCMENMEAITRYAQNDFVNQIDNAVVRQEWDGLDVQGIDYSDYGDLNIVSSPPDPQTIASMARKREDLLAKLQALKASLNAGSIGTDAGVYNTDIETVEKKLQDCSLYASAKACLQ